MNELKDTIELMNSSDYKDRFKAEYYQLKIRYTKLHAMLVVIQHVGINQMDRGILPDQIAHV